MKWDIKTLFHNNLDNIRHQCNIFYRNFKLTGIQSYYGFIGWIDSMCNINTSYLCSSTTMKWEKKLLHKNLNEGSFICHNSFFTLYQVNCLFVLYHSDNWKFLRDVALPSCFSMTYLNGSEGCLRSSGRRGNLL